MGAEDSQVQKQKEALAHSKTVVQRPPKSNPQSSVRHLEATVGEFITYPEFAPSSQAKLPPLVSFRRLVLLLYLTSGATAAAYLVAKLFIQPLLRKVVSAQRDFQQHVHSKITSLAQNLSDSRPAELPDNASTLGSTSDSRGCVPDKLTRLSTMLTTLTTNSETVAHNELSFATEDLLVYLNNQIYTSASFGGYGFNATSDEAKNDIIARVKTDIRSVKGAVLNIRNFPVPATGSK